MSDPADKLSAQGPNVPISMARSAAAVKRKASAITNGWGFCSTARPHGGATKD